MATIYTSDAAEAGDVSATAYGGFSVVEVPFIVNLPTTVVLALNDMIDLVKIPPGAIITGMFTHHAAALGAAAGTFTIGDRATSDKYVATGSGLNFTGVDTFVVGAFPSARYAARDIIRLTVGGAPTGSPSAGPQMRGAVRYVVVSG